MKHGGLTPNGVNSPHFKTGRFSKYLPAHLKDDYEKAASDPELLSLRDDIALYESFQQEQIRRMEQVKFPPWGEVRMLLGSVEDLLTEGDEEAQRRAVDALKELVNRGADAVIEYETAKKQWRQMSDEKTRTAKVEFSRLEALNGMLPVVEVMGVITGLINFIRAEVLGLSELPQESRSRFLQRVQNHWNLLVGARVAAQKREEPLAIEEAPVKSSSLLERTGVRPEAGGVACLR